MKHLEEKVTKKGMKRIEKGMGPDGIEVFCIISIALFRIYEGISNKAATNSRNTQVNRRKE